jgi:hypothetical protein
MTYVIVHALAPIFIIMLLGFWAGKAKMVDNKNVSLLNIFVMDFALPAALFSATVQTPWAGIVAQSPLIVVLTGAMWITYAAIYFLATGVFKIAAGRGGADPHRGAAELCRSVCPFSAACWAKAPPPRCPWRCPLPAARY